MLGRAGVRYRVVALMVGLVVFACPFLMPSFAAAEFFEVDSVADETDAAPGNEFCVTAAGKCTLRAAIEEAGALGGFSFVDFKEEGLFNGTIGGTIALTKKLPTIETELEIFGECVPEGELELRPCVGVAGPGPAEPAFSVKNTGGVAIGGLAISGAKTAIDVAGAIRFKSLGNWFGVKVDRSNGGNGTGILLGPGSERALIGNGGATPNVFANSGAAGLDVFGATGTEVLGNYFGVAPDGATAAANDEDVEVTGVESGPVAIGTRIGNRLSAQAQATAACDGGCNVISGAGTNGVDLEGDGAGEVPATETSIQGNYLGLSAQGTGAVSSGATSIRVGSSPQAAIGGPRAGEGNLFASGSVAILAAPGAGGLLVRGNWIGLDAGAAPIASPTLAGVMVTAEAAASPGGEATIAANEIRMEGGTGISQRGFGAWIAENRIAGATTGIATSLPVEEHGNLIEENSIEDSQANAILLENDLNEVLGNEILGSGGAGVLVSGVAPFGVSGNLIGGDAPWAENAISAAAGGAIRIANAQPSETVVARNHGSANGGLFVDLVSLDPSTEPKGPNGGLARPLVLKVTTTAAVGRAEPEARVRLFRKATSSPGEVESFLGEAVADEDGFWAATYAAPLPPGTNLAATQTVEGRRTSELALAAVPPAPLPPPPAPPARPSPAANPPADTQAPLASLNGGPKGKTKKTTVSFKFSADESGVRFQCKLDKKQFGGCESPRKYKHLKAGKHTFKVRAIDPAGNVGEPAQRKFTVVD